MHLIIKQLNQCSQYAPILAHWAYLEWYNKRDLDFDLILRNYQKISNNQELPIIFVAIANSLPVGMVSLKKIDLWSRKDLGPWLSSLYVIPSYRNKGIGEKLILKILTQSRVMNFNKIYLFLDQNNQGQLADYYCKRQWLFLDDATDNDELPTKIYYFNLTNNLKNDKQ